MDHTNKNPLDLSENLTDEEFTSLSKDEDKLFIVCMGGRPGIQLFFTDLEYNHFIPGTPINDRFNVLLEKWEGMAWVVIEVPMKYQSLVSEVAERNGMRIADGIPMILGEDVSAFPLKGDNVFTLENAPDSVIYKGAEARAKFELAERAKCEAIVHHHMLTVGKMCSNCGCFHDDTFASEHPKEADQMRRVCKDFDPLEPCMLCDFAVERLSAGGPDICAWCDCGKNPKVRPDDRNAYYRK